MLGFPLIPSDDHVYYYLGERLKLERGTENTVWALERRERRVKPEERETLVCTEKTVVQSEGDTLDR